MAVDLSNLMYANSATPYIDQFNEYKKRQQEQRERDVAEYNKNRDADLQKSNAGYDASGRNNYINYMQSQKALPSQLNALGIRGGASESSLIRLGNTYGTNVANNESARQTALADIRSAYAKQISDYDRDLNDRLASAEATARQNQISWEREQVEKDLEYFSGVIDGLYKDKKSYQNLIAQLRASNDPNKEYKIMLATRAMNGLAGSGSSGGGGSSYRSSGGGYSSYGSSGSGSDGYTPDGSYTSPKAITKNVQNVAKSMANTVSKKKTKKIKGDTYYVTKSGTYTKQKSRAALR